MGLQSGVASLAKSLPKAAVTVAAVSLVIPAIVLVSPDITTSSPIESSDKKAVPDPGTLTFVPVTSIEPVKVNVAPSVNLIYNPNSSDELLKNISS